MIENLEIELTEGASDNDSRKEKTRWYPNTIGSAEEEEPDSDKARDLSISCLEFVVHNGSNRTTLRVEEEGCDGTVSAFGATATIVLTIAIWRLVRAVVRCKSGHQIEDTSS